MNEKEYKIQKVIIKNFKEDLPEEMKQLTRLVIKLGWDFAISAGGGEEDDGMLHGMIIGEKSYVNYILKHLD